MATSIITPEDLQQFKAELLQEIKTLLQEWKQPMPHRWLKSSDIRKLLKLSPGTLQNLRVNGTLPFTKIGGIIFYDANDVQRLLEHHKKNAIVPRSKSPSKPH